MLTDAVPDVSGPARVYGACPAGQLTLLAAGDGGCLLPIGIPAVRARCAAHRATGTGVHLLRTVPEGLRVSQHRVALPGPVSSNPSGAA